MRTILNQDTISARRQASIATTFLVASALILPLAACDDTPAQPPQQPTEMTVQQDGRTSRLVQGRENCIAGLIEYGRTPNEAGDICDRAFADAMARRAANEHAPASSSGGGGGGGGSNALFWYLIGRDAGRSSVSVYEGSSSRGLSYLGGYGHTSPHQGQLRQMRCQRPRAHQLRQLRPLRLQRHQSLQRPHHLLLVAALRLAGALAHMADKQTLHENKGGLFSGSFLLYNGCMSITLSDALVNRLKSLRAQEGKDELMLRVTVNSGGCQGFEYSFDLTDQSNPNEDEIFEKDGVAVVIDEISLGFLKGAEIHYKDDLMESKFEIKNPNASSSCGCGTSFAI